MQFMKINNDAQMNLINDGEKKMNKKDIETLKSLLKKANIKNIEAKNFKMYGSARKLYNFNIDNVSEY